MKLLATAGFLLTTALVVYLGKLQQRQTLKALRGTGSALIGYLVSIAFLVRDGRILAHGCHQGHPVLGADCVLASLGAPAG